MITLEEAFGNFCEIRKNNYLAHTIREIEHYILKNYRMHYHILTRQSEIKNKSKVDFFDKGCVIRIPKEGMNDNEIRLRLAHEIGHIISKIELLTENPERLDSYQNDVGEEVFAWCFAFGLIKKKSETYRNRTYKEYVVEDRVLMSMIQRIVEENGNQEVITQLRKDLKFL